MVMRAPRAEKVELPGPAGALEALIETPEGAGEQAFGVICHPHPLHGGTMDNKVVHTLSRAFHEFGAPTIRFNFRGVGASAGEFADGLGETEDALAVIAAGRKRWPRAALWLAGFSFGGAVVIRAAGNARPERLIAVAPAVSRVDLSGADLPASWLLVIGDADELVSPQEVQEWAARQRHPPQFALLSGVGHLFHGRLQELRNAVLAHLKEAA